MGKKTPEEIKAMEYMSRVGAPRVAFESLFPIFTNASTKMAYVSKDTIVIFFDDKVNMKPLEFKYKDPNNWKLNTL